MNWQLNFASTLLLLNAFIVSLVAWQIWKWRNSQGGKFLFWLLIAIVEWSLSSALEAGSITLEAKILWSKIEYIGAASTTPLLLMFSIRLTNRKGWDKPLSLILIWTLPILTILLAATNEWHHLIWTSFTPTPRPGDNLYIYHHGPAFVVFYAFIYTYIIISISLLVWAYRRAQTIYRQQLIAILIGTTAPFIGALIYILPNNPFPGIDFVPICFSFTATIIAMAIHNYRLLDLVPVARDVLIENMRDGVIVMDLNNRVIDINPAAQNLLSLSHTVIGLEVFKVLQDKPLIASTLVQHPSKPVEVQMEKDSDFYIDIRVVPLDETSKHKSGFLATIRDITDRKHMEDVLKAKSKELARLATTDDLTGLYNRRQMDEVLERELRRSERYGPPLSIAQFDIDNFKQVNDNFGHPCGDQVLKAIAREIRACTRFVDIPARMGGDEFLIIFPHTEVQNAWLVLERLRSRLNGLDLRDAGCSEVHITISGGVTAWQMKDTSDDILKRVDQLLYQAKEAGKNCIVQDAVSV